MKDNYYLYNPKWFGSKLNFLITKKERLIISKSLESFISIIFDAPLKIITNSNNKFASKELTKKLQYWLIDLESYSYILVTDKKRNIPAAILSCQLKMQKRIILSVSLAEIKREQILWTCIQQLKSTRNGNIKYKRNALILQHGKSSNNSKKYIRNIFI